jgi:hypothetical protein
MVFLDDLAPGRPKAYVIADKCGFRFSSSVAYVGGELIFGNTPQDMTLLGDAIWYESIKMRVAAEASPEYKLFCYGGTPSPPPGLRFSDLAILTLWSLRTRAADSISTTLSTPKSDFAISVTVGIPRSFYESPALRSTFFYLAQAAERLHKQGPFPNGSLKLADALDMITSVKADIATRAEDDRYWLRSEAEADMFWPVRCPSVPPGAYAQVDIGAGTTNATIVSIRERNHNQRWIKDSLGFYGAQSVPTGTDAIDSRLAEYLTLPPEECLVLRGQERAALAQVGTYALAEIFAKIREAYDLAWRRATSRFNQAERQTFHNHGIFVTGGGSLIPGLHDALSAEPSRPGFKRRIFPLDRPSDLFMTNGEPVAMEDLVFLSSAYGLSYHPDEIPPTYQVEQQPPVKQIDLGLGAIYEK